MVILRVNDIMAYSRISGDDIVSSIFADEETFDDSDSDSRDDVYGYLGARAIPRRELIEESNVLTGGADEGENDENTLSNNEDTLSANYYDVEDIGDEIRHKDDASSSNVLGQGRLSPHSDEDNIVHMDEAVSEIKAVL